MPASPVSVTGSTSATAVESQQQQHMHHAQPQSIDDVSNTTTLEHKQSMNGPLENIAQVFQHKDAGGVTDALRQPIGDSGRIQPAVAAATSPSSASVSPRLLNSASISHPHPQRTDDASAPACMSLESFLAAGGLDLSSPSVDLAQQCLHYMEWKQQMYDHDEKEKHSQTQSQTQTVSHVHTHAVPTNTEQETDRQHIWGEVRVDPETPSEEDEVKHGGQ